MKQAYNKSLQMIKILHITNEEEYNRMLQYYLVLSLESMKYISQTNDFANIIELAKEVA